MFHEAAAAAVSISCFFFIVAALTRSFLDDFFFLPFSLLFRDWFYSSGRMCVYVRARGWLKEKVQKGLATIVVVSAAIDDGI